jgi:LemA protein
MIGRPTLRRARFALAAAALLAGTGCGYNRIQQLDEQINTAQGNIEAQLQRRADLIPNLVNTVKGYAQQEQVIFTRVADAQRGLTGAIAGHDPAQMAQANDNLTRALVPMLTLVQAYPKLQSDQLFLKLQDELTGTENRVAVSRTDYNGAVREYNTLIRTFPSAMTAKVTGAKPRAYFEVTNPASREAPTVDFSQPGAPAAPATPATPAAPAPAPSTGRP